MHRDYNGAMVKLMRVGAGLSQGELAEKVGVSRPTITRWENGTSPILGAAQVALRAVFNGLPKGPDMRSPKRVRRTASGRRLSVTVRSKTALLGETPAERRIRKSNGSQDIPS